MSTALREPTPEEIEKMSAGIPRGTATQKQREAAISTAIRMRDGFVFLAVDQVSDPRSSPRRASGCTG